MLHPNTERRRASLLLAITAVWLIAVTLCSTRLVADEREDHEQAGHEHASAPAGEHHHDDDCGCSCQSFNAFPLPSGISDTVKAPFPASIGPLFLFAWLDESFCEPPAVSPFIASTGPPGRQSLAEQVLQQCRHNHAPPSLS